MSDKKDDDKTEFERSVDSTAQLAMLVYAYYLHLIECGFKEKQAEVFALGYQNSIMAAANKQTKE